MMLCIEEGGEDEVACRGEHWARIPKIIQKGLDRFGEAISKTDLSFTWIPFLNAQRRSRDRSLAFTHFLHFGSFSFV